MAIVAKDPALGHVGNINAYVDVPNRVADVGILVGEKAVWGKGYGSEAWIGFTQFLLREQGLRKVTAGTLASNHGMLGIMRRAGMEIEAIRKRQALVEGQEVDVVYAAAFASPA
jgi:RimJ/RimL family protein N-acetyltransferase